MVSILAVLLAACRTRLQNAPRRRLAFGSCLAIIVLAAVLAGCGNAPPPYTGTPKGPATFTVTGTAGGTTISAQINVTIQ
jgi:outer membrane PBP1 activator LpoA protein